ncbi:hypothetical protein [Mesorhizobium sp. WSM4313]|uniref:hypothetical protein n=1 Tax=Mesorhizobium sp. WSM4313 TaxID=2029412 RepID=UPI001140BB23|nr:hypothetical protein [Mesorhizobium sp. WSM4313]
MTLDIGRGANFRIAGHQPTVESSVVLVFDVRPEPDINVWQTSKTTTLALRRCLPLNHVETMVRGFAFG